MSCIITEIAFNRFARIGGFFLHKLGPFFFISGNIEAGTFILSNDTRKFGLSDART